MDNMKFVFLYWFAIILYVTSPARIITAKIFDLQSFWWGNQPSECYEFLQNVKMNNEEILASEMIAARHELVPDPDKDTVQYRDHFYITNLIPWNDHIVFHPEDIRKNNSKLLKKYSGVIPDSSIPVVLSDQEKRFLEYMEEQDLNNR